MVALAVSRPTCGGYFNTAVASRPLASPSGTGQLVGAGFEVGALSQVSPCVSLAVSGSSVYAGACSRAGGIAATNIAKWNGSSWTALGAGINGASPDVLALAVSGSDVFAGGLFTTAGGSPATNIAKWDGSSWTALGAGINIGVEALAVSGANVYAGGSFTTAGGSPASNIAKWDGSSWSALGSGIGGSPVDALAVAGANLYAAGHFTTAGGSAAKSIAKWDGSSWSALGSGMDNTVKALAVSGTNLYAGGAFLLAGGSHANHLAKWDGSSWTTLASNSGMNSQVLALAMSGTNLYAGGAFTTAGGSVSNYIAKWDGSSWSALAPDGKPPMRWRFRAPTRGWCVLDSGRQRGQVHRQMGWEQLTALLGLNGLVYALAASGSNVRGGAVHHGGRSPPPTSPSGTEAVGRRWARAGAACGDLVGVYALAMSGAPCMRAVPLDDGRQRGPLTPPNGTGLIDGARFGGAALPGVLALAVSGSDQRGRFRRAGGSNANYAPGGRERWSALGSGLNSTVYSLAVSGATCMRGRFNDGGGSNANYIAKWDGIGRR